MSQPNQTSADEGRTHGRTKGQPLADEPATENQGDFGTRFAKSLREQVAGLLWMLAGLGALALALVAARFV